MKTVFVAGFFDPVLKTLQDTFPDQLKAGAIVWIRQAGPGRELSIKDFKSRLFDKLAKGVKQVLIIMAVLRGKQWAEQTIRSIITTAKEEHPDVEIQLRTETNAQNSSAVLNEIAAFGLFPPPEISMERIIEKLDGKKVLCIGLDGRAGFQNGLERAGFPKEAYTEHFVELTIPAGRNSNLIELLDGKAKSFDHLLYAWAGLRTLPPSVKKGYSGVAFEAASPFEVVLLFKRWILGQ